MFTVHKFDQQNKYTGSEVLPFIPMNSTLVQPPEVSGELDAFFENGAWTVKQRPVVLPITNVVVDGATKSEYGVHWVPAGKVWRLRADIPLPEAYNGAELMVIIERVRRNDANETIVIDDDRSAAVITYNSERGTSEIEIIASFDVRGNYRIDPTRLNIGLENANKPFRLSFDPVEFDSYAPRPVFTPDNP